LKIDIFYAWVQGDNILFVSLLFIMIVILFVSQKLMLVKYFEP